MRTFTVSSGTIERRWHVIDAQGKVLGRLATVAARLLQGKNKAVYTPFIDTGDHVVIVNAAQVKLTGRKEEQKIYRKHSGYEGGLREQRAKEVRQRTPRRVNFDEIGRSDHGGIRCRRRLHLFCRARQAHRRPRRFRRA
jgi:large subunit ribosomal protein L13